MSEPASISDTAGLWMLIGLCLFLGASPPRAGAVEDPVAEAAADSRTDRWLRNAARVLTDMNGRVGRVYLPVFTTNPNAGATYGFLPVWLLTNDRHQIEHIIAPLASYNRTFGPALSGTYYYYPSDRARVRGILEKSAKSNYRAAARYEDLGFLDGRCVLKLDANYEADGTPRFFGLGPASPKDGEASYRSVERLAKAEIGVKYWGPWQLTAGWKYRRTDVLPGVFQTSGNLDAKFRGSTTVSIPRLALSRDTRDFPSTPGSGTYSEVFTEFSETALGSAASYQRYGGQWRLYAPTSRTLATAFHIQGEWAQGGEPPFPELASLGGPRSLRAFPEGRFQDRGALYVNLEERWTIHALDIVNAVTEFQIAPFLDAGTVFHDVGEVQAKYLQAVGGVALRAVVKPTVVGRVEVGAGREGPAAFVGIDYPF